MRFKKNERKKALEQLKSIDAQIHELETKIVELQRERQTILNEFHEEDTEMLDKLPARARNSLSRFCGIDSDYKLRKFISGDATVISHKMVGFHMPDYKKADTYLARLTTVPNIGKGTAGATVKILKLHKFI